MPIPKWPGWAAAGLAVMTASVLSGQAFSAPAPKSPAELYGPLFTAVQLGHVFTNSQTFADATPKMASAVIMADYVRQKPEGTAALQAFVEAHFTLPPEASLPAAATERLTLREYLKAGWLTLRREPLKPMAGSAALTLPAPYAASGRTDDMSYWDSYFIALGLVETDQHALADGTIDNVASLIERYGRMPGVTRTYALSRSQPPVFALMAGLSSHTDTRAQARTLAALKREHAFWMAGADCASAQGACARVVCMPDGSLLNRYWDDRDTPRDEAYAEDVATASATARPEAQVYRDLRAAAESGWDVSSRWLGNAGALSTIHTTDIVPVDLNSLLWTLESEIAKRCTAAKDAGCATEFTARADARKAAMQRFLWRGDKGAYYDWDRASQKPTAILSAATLYPLFAGLADADQARAVATTVRGHLLADGGLRATEIHSGQAWDSPNGWAPLQWIAVTGLGRYGEDALARDIAKRWITTVNRDYRASGRTLEKYDVENRKAFGGDYSPQSRFGWTNGVTRALMARYPDLDPDK